MLFGFGAQEAIGLNLDMVILICAAHWRRFAAAMTSDVAARGPVPKPSASVGENAMSR
jgi:hypothetical protein